MKSTIIFIIISSFIYSNTTIAQKNNIEVSKANVLTSDTIPIDSSTCPEKVFKKQFILNRYQFNTHNNSSYLPYNQFKNKNKPETYNAGALIGAVAGGILGYTAGYLLGEANYFDNNYPGYYQNSPSNHGVMGALHGTFIGSEFGNSLGEAFEGSSPFIIGFENDWEYYKWIQSQ